MDCLDQKLKPVRERLTIVMSPNRPGDFVVRISLLFLAGLLLAEGHQNWLRGKITTHPEVVILIIATYLFAFALFILATVRPLNPRLGSIVALLAILFVITASTYVIAVVEFEGVYRTDAMALSQQAAKVLLHRDNPYSTDLLEGLTTFPVDPQFLTLTSTGEIITTMNYPALHFLIFLPAVAIGIQDMRFVVLAFEIATLFVIYRKLPVHLKALGLLPILAGSDLAIGFPAGSVTDFLWVLPLVIAAFEINKSQRAGVAYGLACAVKQIVWLSFPFLLVWQWKSATHDLRKKHSLEFVLCTSLGFLVPNLVFIVWNPHAWIDGVLAPVSAGLVILSQGLSIISQVSGVPLPPTFYTLCAVTVFAILLLNYYLYFDRVKYALWAFPPLILWFSFRALQTYFVHWIPLLIIAASQLLGEER